MPTSPLTGENPAAFTLDPTLPWLCTDPAMQTPSAFREMKTVTLNAQPYEPMALYFPPSAELAMRRVTSLDQLQQGAAYWSELSYFEASKNELVTRYAMGRYVGPAYPEAKSTAQRWKKGEAHLKLESDVLDCNLRHYLLHEDGTTVVFVDVKSSTHRLYQLTHYVNLPAAYLAQVGVEAIKQTGLTLRQACWLRQEKELYDNAAELTVQTSWGGVALPDYRVVLPVAQVGDFWVLQELLEQLTPGEAKRRKAGAVAITYRTRNHATGLCFTNTEYHKLEEAALLLDWLRTHSEAQRARLDAAICQQQVSQAAEVLRTQRRAEQQAKEAAQAVRQAQQAAADLQRGSLPLRHHEYAGLAALALAA